MMTKLNVFSPLPGLSQKITETIFGPIYSSTAYQRPDFESFSYSVMFILKKSGHFDETIGEKHYGDLTLVKLGNYPIVSFGEPEGQGEETTTGTRTCVSPLPPLLYPTKITGASIINLIEV